MSETARVAALRITLTGGASVTVPFWGRISAGWAINETQAGPYVSFPMAPSPFAVETLAVANKFFGTRVWHYDC